MKRINVSLATRIATEHLSYRSLIVEIETDLARVSQTSTASLDGLRKLLRSFHSQVRRHFALEERGGLFEVYDEHPWRSAGTPGRCSASTASSSSASAASWRP